MFVFFWTMKINEIQCVLDLIDFNYMGKNSLNMFKHVKQNTLFCAPQNKETRPFRP